MQQRKCLDRVVQRMGSSMVSAHPSVQPSTLKEHALNHPALVMKRPFDREQDAWSETDTVTDTEPSSAEQDELGPPAPGVPPHVCNSCQRRGTARSSRAVVCGDLCSLQAGWLLKQHQSPAVLGRSHALRYLNLCEVKGRLHVSKGPRALPSSSSETCETRTPNAPPCQTPPSKASTLRSLMVTLLTAHLTAPTQSPSPRSPLSRRSTRPR